MPCMSRKRSSFEPDSAQDFSSSSSNHNNNNNNNDDVMIGPEIDFVRRTKRLGVLGAARGCSTPFENHHHFSTAAVAGIGCGGGKRAASGEDVEGSRQPNHFYKRGRVGDFADGTTTGVIVGGGEVGRQHHLTVKVDIPASSASFNNNNTDITTPPTSSSSSYNSFSHIMDNNNNDNDEIWGSGKHDTNPTTTNSDDVQMRPPPPVLVVDEMLGNGNSLWSVRDEYAAAATAMPRRYWAETAGGGVNNMAMVVYEPPKPNMFASCSSPSGVGGGVGVGASSSSSSSSSSLPPIALLTCPSPPHDVKQIWDCVQRCLAEKQNKRNEGLMEDDEMRDDAMAD